MPTSMPWFLRARLKTRQLLLLIAIGDEGNIHRAAEILNMSQPAASKLLKDLEDVLGISLFERLPRGMRPTWYGETMIRYARIALSSLHQAGSEIEALKSGRFGEVSVGAITGPALNLLAASPVDRRARAPETCAYSSTSSPATCCWSGCRRAKLDIMIGRLFERDDKKNLSYERLADEPVCAVVRPGHPMLQRRRPEAEAARAVAVDRAALGQRAAASLRADVPGGGPDDSAAAHRDLVAAVHDEDAAAELFIAVVPTDVARYYASYGMVAMLPIQLSCTMDAFGIIMRTDWLLSPAAKVVLRAIKTAAISTYDYRAGAAETRKRGRFRPRSTRRRR